MAKDLVQIANDVIEGVGLIRKGSAYTMKAPAHIPTTQLGGTLEQGLRSRQDVER